MHRSYSVWWQSLQNYDGDSDSGLHGNQDLDNDEDSDDDYEQTRNSHHDRKPKLRCLGHRTSPTTSEDKAENRQLEEELYDKLDQQPTKQALAGPDKENQDDLDNPPDDEECEVRPGPIDDAMRDEAMAIKQQYEDQMLALAQEKGVSVHSLYRAVGEVTAKHRVVSAWDTFQKYEAAHHGHPEGGMISSWSRLHELSSIQRLLKSMFSNCQSSIRNASSTLTSLQTRPT